MSNIFSYQFDPLDTDPNPFEITAMGVPIAKTSTITNAQKLVETLNAYDVFVSALKRINELESVADSLRGQGVVDDSDLKAMRAMSREATQALVSVRRLCVTAAEAQPPALAPETEAEGRQAADWMEE